MNVEVNVIATKPTKAHEKKQYMVNEKIIEKELVYKINKCVFEGNKD